MKKNVIRQRLFPIRYICLVLFCTTISFSIQEGETSLDWLEDQPPVNSVTRNQTNKLSLVTTYPRRSTGTLQQNLSADQMACFDMICRKPIALETIAQAQSINPNLAWLRIFSPQAYQGFNEDPDKQLNGMPFNTSGPATANNEIFAGHFSYKPFTTLSAGIGGESNITISVANASRISNGTYYYVIRPAGSWDNAEHVEVQKSGSVITILTRGYKSVAKDWPAGSIIAQHQMGNGSNPLLWGYNQSSRCPLDGNGKRANEAISAWLVENYDKDASGQPVAPAVCDGILYDADFNIYVEGGSLSTNNADMDNDGEADYGMDNDGTNFWGDGLEYFYSAVRSGLDAKGRTNAIILGGVDKTWGILSNNGTQMEGGWGDATSPGGVVESYDDIGRVYSEIKAQSGWGQIGPRVSDFQGKEASAIYPGTTNETRNAPVRFDYAMSMMFNGAWFSNQNSFDIAFHYFDEDAVYLEAGENYGKSVLRSNTTDILQNNKWLGEALGQYKRIYDPSAFGISNNLYPNGNFESVSVSDWTTKNASIERVTDKHYEGSASLRITPNQPSTDIVDYTSSYARGPSVSLSANQEYSLCLAINSESYVRHARIKIGSFIEVIIIPPGWSKHVLTWRQNVSATSGITIEIGRELTPIWIDQLYLFEGSADVFRRDFENGIILANASQTPKTIVLGGYFQRIRGNLDTQVNNGQKDITQVTLPAYDGLFLIRQAGPSSIESHNANCNIYPNPFTENFVIAPPDEVVELDIYDIRGNKILNQPVSLNTRVLITSLSDQPAGIYFVELTGPGIKFRQKLVKQ